MFNTKIKQNEILIKKFAHGDIPGNLYNTTPCPAA